jgi:glycosyltransferase involved in cell wall biosynthesis
MRISIITVCRNAENTIADTIESVRVQSHEAYEHIIIDGASEDGTVSVIESHRHNRLKLVSEPDDGLYDAMNKGVALATGDLIGCLNSDDFFSRTDALSLISTAADANPDADAISGGLVMVDPDKLSRIRRVYNASSYRRWMLRFGHMPPHPGFYTRKASFKAVGEFVILHKVSSDFEWMVRFYYVHAMKSVPLRKSIVVMRSGGVSTRGWKSTLAINEEVQRALNMHGVWTATPLIWSKYLFKAGQIAARGAFSSVPEPVRWSPG